MRGAYPISVTVVARYHRDAVRSAVVVASLLVACGRPAPAPPPRGARAAPELAITPAEALLAWRAAGDTAAIRAHAWTQWRELTRGREPAWDGWLRSDLVFSPAPLAPTAELAFRPPRPITQGGVPIAAEPLLYDVLLDADAAAFVRARDLAHRATLGGLTGGVPELPVGAAALKRVWFPIHRRGLTALPVWDEAPTRADADGNPPSTWARVVAVDPSRTEIPDGETAEVTFAGRALRARVVPLARFYHRALATDGEVRTARVVVGQDDVVARGDFVALVALHLTTKEIPEWTWATWWWHDRADTGPFAAGRPAELAGWAASYRMDATLSADAPCMNPWLEARFPGGLASSCASCHQRAAFGAREFLPVPTAATPPSDAYFAGKVTTDFLWSIALEAK